ncbi:MAG: metallophosphoesterase [Thermofilaceae archaeon]
MRIFYASDIHGSEVCFRKFINAAKAYKVDVLILGGDITGKVLVPIIEKGGKYFAELGGKKWEAASQAELNTLIRSIRDSGFYTVVLTEDEFLKIKDNPQLVDNLFNEIMVKTVSSWIKLADERLDGSNIECYLMPGNDDRVTIDDAFKCSARVVNPDCKVLEIKGGLKLVSLGLSNPTPWRTSREYPEEVIYEKLNRLIRSAEDPDITLLNVHVPPYGTPIDLAPLLDHTLRPVTRGGQAEMVHVGSISVRKIIEEFQPLTSLHGHIHESRGVIRIGKTQCFNPGSDYSSGALRGVLLEVERGKVKNYMFTYG